MPHNHEKAAMRFDRMEVAGSLGDLGTLLPLTLGMVMVCGMSGVGTFFSIGLFYILAGLWFRVPVSVQPMKAIGAYAIGTAMSAQQVGAATLLVGIFLGLIGLTGAITWIGRIIPKPVIRGVQLSTGVLLMGQGMKLILGTSPQQRASGLVEPFFTLQQLGPLPLGLAIGIAGICLTLLLLNNRRWPAALVLLGFGLICGLVLHTPNLFDDFRPGLHLPGLLPSGFPAMADFGIALFVLVLPQIPMSIGNAAIATSDLSKDYFGDDAARVSYRSLTISMAIASCTGFLLGAIPLCHGAGGLAAHYRFGARTAGSNLIIGSIFLALALFFGQYTVALLHLLPLAILGVLLVFSGIELSLAILDMLNRQMMFIVLVMLAITLTVNLAWAFLGGILLSQLLRRWKIEI